MALIPILKAADAATKKPEASFGLSLRATGGGL
jgi:hypothetical protein